MLYVILVILSDIMLGVVVPFMEFSPSSSKVQCLSLGEKCLLVSILVIGGKFVKFFTLLNAFDQKVVEFGFPLKGIRQTTLLSSRGFSVRIPLFG